MANWKIVLGIVVVIASGCDLLEEPKPCAGTGPFVTIDPAAVTIKVGETFQARARINVSCEDDPEPATWKWSSTDTTVVRVTPLGLASGAGVGNARLTAEAVNYGEGIRGLVLVTVTSQ